MYFGEVLNNQIIYEFNFKEALSTLKNKIKNAILHFLDKLENWLKKGKDNKIKQFVIGLIQKTRKLLTKVNNANTQDECKEVSDELNEYRDEFNDITEEKDNYINFTSLDSDAFIKAIKEKDYSRLKTSIISSIRNNPEFKNINNQNKSEAEIAMNILQKKIPEMFEKYKILEFENSFNINEKEKWNKEYFLRQTFLLGENFCWERFNNIKVIGKQISR